MKRYLYQSDDRKGDGDKKTPEKMQARVSFEEGSIDRSKNEQECESRI